LLLPTIILAYRKEGCSFCNFMILPVEVRSFLGIWYAVEQFIRLKYIHLQKENYLKMETRQARRNWHFHHGVLCMSPDSGTNIYIYLLQMYDIQEMQCDVIRSLKVDSGLENIQCVHHIQKRGQALKLPLFKNKWSTYNFSLL